TARSSTNRSRATKSCSLRSILSPTSTESTSSRGFSCICCSRAREDGMSTIDVSRFLLQRNKHYIGARHQQRRILLDSDFTDQAEPADEDRRRALAHVFGPHGSPDMGFSIRQPLSHVGPDTLPPGAALPVTSVELNGKTVSLRDVGIR